MATILWKDGQPSRVRASHVKNHIEAGWSPHDPTVPPTMRDQTQYPESIKDVEEMPENQALDAIASEMGLKYENNEKDDLQQMRTESGQTEPEVLQSVSRKIHERKQTNSLSIPRTPQSGLSSGVVSEVIKPKKRGRPKKV